MGDNRAGTIRAVICGHSGIGKTPLGSLFNVPAWEPFRIRVPRDRKDASLCKSQAEFDALEQAQRARWGQPLYESPPGHPNYLRVYREWSFFQFRGRNQCLVHIAAARGEENSLRVEISVPVFVEMLRNRDRLREAFSLDPANLIVILLNPTSQSFQEMPAPSIELYLATQYAVSERSRLQHGSVELADSLRRVEFLRDELAGWRELWRMCPQSTIECRQWAHFEFRYWFPDRSPPEGSAQAELCRARESLLGATGEQAPHLLARLEAVLRTPDEIAKLDDIV